MNLACVRCGNLVSLADRFWGEGGEPLCQGCYEQGPARFEEGAAFEEWYAARSMIRDLYGRVRRLERLDLQRVGLGARACECGEDGCRGWRMENARLDSRGRLLRKLRHSSKGLREIVVEDAEPLSADTVALAEHVAKSVSDRRQEQEARDGWRRLKPDSIAPTWQRRAP